MLHDHLDALDNDMLSRDSSSTGQRAAGDLRVNCVLLVFELPNEQTNHAQHEECSCQQKYPPGEKFPGNVRH